ncbi:hypothetical protein K432DRAFT_462302 [Lepidopterella palustris CBS 459.81]|uniref:4,5-dihydroxyphthalate decarboxylase n=1 Tax=Lepidopterella palustris CBS 459.81 TaxID=1314670 RepID=A0A8E2E421_9PEZI|nr:hypothetical protein K432DRAFT_462302 [Lepidopterella palustris CBS 459.81]
MLPIQCSFASVLYDRMVPLALGEVQPAGLSLNFIDVPHPRQIFDRMIGNREFDTSELSASEYITRHVSGDKSFVALPAFPLRAFRHKEICVNTNIVKEPKDLKGKRVGIQIYTMTAGVWIRGLLQHEYGVDLSTIEWVEGKMDGPGPHGKPSILPPLAPVTITQNMDPARSLSDLLEAGDIAATIGAQMPECLGKARAPHIRRLFPDYKAVEIDYYKRTGIFPIMHVVAMQREYYEANRFAASALFDALDRSKELARKRMEASSIGRYMLPWLPEHVNEIREVFGGDFWPYGVEKNRKTLEMLVQFLYEQSMISKKVPIEELFAPVKKMDS